MNESERDSFLKGITTERTSTSMSTVVPMASRTTPPAPQSLQPPPPQEEQRQEIESTGDAGNDPTSSSRVEQTGDAGTRQDVMTDANVPEQDIQATDEGADNDSLVETATVQSSLQATAGSTTTAAEQETDTVRPPTMRNHLRRYTIGTLHLDSYVDIFNLLSATASNYVDPEGTYVRKLSLANYPFQLRAALRDNDPVIVLVESEIEQATLTMSGDLSRVREYYPAGSGIDWVKFQYHLAIMQHVAPIGWTAPGFRMGGRFPLTVQNMCQLIMNHDAFATCHTTPIREWHKVRHMITLGKDSDARSNYARDAIRALLQYNKYASENNNEVEQMMLDAELEQYSTWAPRMDRISEAIRTGSDIVEVPVERLQQMEQRRQDAEEALMDQLQKEDEEQGQEKGKET